MSTWRSRPSGWMGEPADRICRRRAPGRRLRAVICAWQAAGDRPRRRWPRQWTAGRSLPGRGRTARELRQTVPLHRKDEAVCRSAARHRGAQDGSLSWHDWPCPQARQARRPVRPGIAPPAQQSPQHPPRCRSRYRRPAGHQGVALFRAMARPEPSSSSPLKTKRQVRSRPLQLRGWSPIWVDRTGFCFSSFTGTLRIPVLGGEKHVVNQWLGLDTAQIGMLLKMICKFKDLSLPLGKTMAV